MSNDRITLSINPTYLCNFRCSFCYLSDSQLGQKKVIDTEVLFEKMSEVSSRKIIDHIDLYGGEIALIEASKLLQIVKTIQTFYSKKINIITNFSVMSPIFYQEDIEVSVSWDYKARELFGKVYQNMMTFKRPFHILILASKSLIEMNDEELDDMINKLNQLPNLSSVEIKPYSDNPHHGQGLSHHDFENWVKKWIIKKACFKFEFINISKIEASLQKRYSSWSDDHLYINPEGNFEVLDFTDANKEFFLKLSSFDEYERWATQEKIKVKANSFCGSCEFLGNCLSEHLQPVKDLDQSCNGFRNLLMWYRDPGVSE